MAYAKRDLERMALGGVPRDRVSATLWLRILLKSKASYHIDDDPREVIDYATGERSFDEDAAGHLARCLEACAGALGSWKAVWDAYYPPEEWSSGQEG